MLTEFQICHIITGPVLIYRTHGDWHTTHTSRTRFALAAHMKMCAVVWLNNVGTEVWKIERWSILVILTLASLF